MDLKPTKILNAKINNLTWDEAKTVIAECIEKRLPCDIASINVDQMIKMEQNPAFEKFVAKARLSLVDGTPIMLIAKLLRRPLAQKMPGPDLAEWMMEFAAERGYRVFFLGAAPGVAEEAAGRMKEKYKNLIMAGTYSPCRGFEKKDAEIRKINRILRESRADMMIVGLGSPKQELFIDANREQFDIPVTASLGAAIDFMAGNRKRAPQWVNKIGMEWLYRFLHEPRRLFKRYFIDDMKILGLLWKYR